MHCLLNMKAYSLNGFLFNFMITYLVFNIKIIAIVLLLFVGDLIIIVRYKI